MFDLINDLADRLEKARRIAEGIGELVGVVSRRAPSSVSEGYSKVLVDVPPSKYYGTASSIGVGDVLIAVDARTLKPVGLRVISMRREDAASELGAAPPPTLEPEPQALLTNAVIEAVTVLTADGDPFLSPIEPQSPVVIPSNPGVVERVLGLPEEGVTLGYLHTGSHAVAGGKVRVALPRREFFKHMLIIGTTGSGKTTLIKNLLYALSTEWPEVMVSVLDAAGDYTQIVIPAARGEEAAVYSPDAAPRWVTALVPIRRGDEGLNRLAHEYVMERVAAPAKLVFGEEPRVEVDVDAGRDFGSARSIIVRVMFPDGSESVVEFLPIGLTYQQLRPNLSIFPIFSRQAKIYLDNVIGFIEHESGGVVSFTHLYALLREMGERIIKTLKIHKRTLENIERALNFIASAEEVDVRVGDSFIGMPYARDLARNYRGPVILDLDYAAVRGAHYLITNIIAYEYLRRLFAWKKSAKEGARPAIVVLDEAHRFFPAEGTSEEEVEVLADFIARISRLGRARGLGLIFSTHTPRDVHRVVIQLTNTKVVLRSDREYLEDLGVPREFLGVLELAPDRVAMLKTPAVRSGYAFMRTPPPLLGHVDVGRIIAGE